MTQAQVSYTDSCPLVLTGSLESLRLSSDVRERLIVECFTNNNGHAALYISVNDTHTKYLVVLSLPCSLEM